MPVKYPLITRALFEHTINKIKREISKTLPYDSAVNLYIRAHRKECLDREWGPNKCDVTPSITLTLWRQEEGRHKFKASLSNTATRAGERKSWVGGGNGRARNRAWCPDCRSPCLPHCLLNDWDCG